MVCVVPFQFPMLSRMSDFDKIDRPVDAVNRTVKKLKPKLHNLPWQS